MRDDVLKVIGIICLECNSVIDVLFDKNEPLYVDTPCSCGSVGFYTVTMNIRIICERPHDREPLFKWDGIEFFEGGEDDKR